MPSSHPVFVVGAPRTGTTLVREILNRHPRIHLFDEVHYFERVWDDRAKLGDLSDPTARRAAVERVLRIARDFGSDQAVLEVLPPEELESRMIRGGGGHAALLRALLEAGAQLRHADIWGDSSPHDVLYLSTLFEWYPDARVVALVRDPRAFLGSYKNYHRRGVSSYRERYNPVTNSVLWRSSMTAVLDAERMPWGCCVLRVRYEDLVRDPGAWVKRMCEHVGVDYDPRMLDVERSNSSFVAETDTGRERGIVTTSTERWKTELTPTEIWLAERITGPWMDRFGYERLSASRAIHPSPLELTRIASLLPWRLFNMLFRSHKPFRITKVKRVLGHLRGGSTPSALLSAALAIASLAGCSDSGEGPPPEPEPKAQFALASSCAECHPNHVREWESSMHAYGGVDPVMLAMEELAHAEAGASGLAEECLACHAPAAHRADSRERSLLEEGVTCDVCHSMTDVPPVASIDFLEELDPSGPKIASLSGPIPNEAHDSEERTFFAKSTQCASCHQVNFPSGEGLENTHQEWVDSNLLGMGIECQNCHMPIYQGAAAVGGPDRPNLHRHTFVGVDYAYEPFRGIDLETQKQSIRALLGNSVTMTLVNVPVSIGEAESVDFDVSIVNDRTGHSIPSGVSFAREMWIEVTLEDALSNTIGRSGWLEPNGDLVDPADDPSLAFFGAIATDAAGNPTPFNFRAVAVDESRMIPFAATRVSSYSFDVPPGAVSPLELRVAVRFRPVRPSMIRELALDRLLPIEIFEVAADSSVIEVR